MKIFEAEKMNWGLHSIEDWHSTHYFVYGNGTVIRTVKGGECCDAKRKMYYQLTPRRFTRFKNLLKSFNDQEMGDGCDGIGWEMKTFDENGKPNECKCGYLFGCKVLEQIASILEKSAFTDYENFEH